MSVAPILRDVYTAYLGHWGKPSRAIEFEGTADADGAKLTPLDVFVWEAAEPDDLTLFATIGMSATAMSGAAHRAELHLGIVGPLERDSVNRMALYLADLSRYPFDNGTHLDWWHKVQDTGVIPEFPGFRTVLLHPKFEDTGIDEIATGEGVVKILNVVPLSPDEALKPLVELMQHFDDSGIDVFSNARCMADMPQADEPPREGDEPR